MNLLIYTDLEWSLGALHAGLAAALRAHGYTVTLKSWATPYKPFAFEGQYDLVMTLPSCAAPLVAYGVPKGKTVIVAHAESDIQKFQDFDDYAGYGVTSDALACSSLAIGVRRVPLVVRCGIEFDRFHYPAATKLEVLGYATIMERRSEYGVEQKRGWLAQVCAEEAGLRFTPAQGFTAETMPMFYRSIDCLIVPSLQDGSPRPPLEAAASGRLVISTPVGHVPRLACEGLGLMGPLDARDFLRFASERLAFYKANVEAFTAECIKGQRAAKARDWPNVVGDWIELFTRSL